MLVCHTSVKNFNLLFWRLILETLCKQAKCDILKTNAKCYQLNVPLCAI